MIVLVGASASGKTELAKLLFQQFGYQKCITTTTRQMRVNETNDIDYHFLSQKEFKSLAEKYAFLEVTEYHGNFYGIQKKDVFDNGVVIVDPSGANSLINQIYDDAYIVYVEATERLRKQRMKDRGDQNDLIENRILFDRNIFMKKNILKINYAIKNEDENLVDLAKSIHEHYQLYLKTKSKNIN